MVVLAVDVAHLSYQAKHINDDRGPLITVVNISLMIVAILAVGLRFWSRKLVKATWREDDLAIVLSLVLSIVLNILQLITVPRGLGKHSLRAGLKGVTFMLQTLYAYEIIYCISIGVIKISILLLYNRLFPTYYFQLASHVTGVFVLLNSIAFAAASVFQCRPIAFSWDKTIEGTCVDYVALFRANTALNVLTDAMLLILPLFVVWSLSITPRQKVGLTLIFLLGSFVCIATGLRLPAILQIPIGANPTWTFTYAAIWSSIEVCLAVVCACLPVMRPLFRAAFANRFSGMKWPLQGYFSGSGPSDVPSFPRHMGWSSISDHAPPSSQQPTTMASVYISSKPYPHDDNDSFQSYKLNEIRVQCDLEWAYSVEGP